MNKHQKLIDYISELPVGTNISVRGLAKTLNVSDGTAYRAIKDAETQGYVSTIPKTGTVRIKKSTGYHNYKVTFAELVSVVDGKVLGGKSGLYKSLDKFVIGAMELKEMSSYISEDSILIVGNRDEAHKLALKKGAAVLISGGFDTSKANKNLADQLELPIIQSGYDTYRIATLINNSMNEKSRKEEILHVEDIMNQDVYYLYDNKTYGDWKNLLDDTRHSRFPVVNNSMGVVGVVTSKDVTGNSYKTPIKKLMTKDPITTSPETLIASVAYIMIWEGIEMIPVVKQDKLIGIVTRQDVMKSLQFGHKGKDYGISFNKILFNNFSREVLPDGVNLTGEITPDMTNQIGGVTPHVLFGLLVSSGYLALGYESDYEMVPENCSIYFLGPLQLEQEINIRATVIEITRTIGKITIEVTAVNRMLVKALLSFKILERPK